MDQQQPHPSHKCNQPERVACPSAEPHARRNSTAYNGAGANSPAATRKQSQRQVMEAQDDGSRTPETHAAFGHASAPSIPNPPDTPSTRTSPDEPQTPMSPSKDFTDDQIDNEVYQYIREEMDHGGHHSPSWCFARADERPPITPESLAELDMPRIINNPKLRHDVNFDRELHFRPNLDGSKGKQKMQQAEQYWKALEAELFMLNRAARGKLQRPSNELYWNRIGKASLKRLPQIFTAIRDILKTLVPDYDQRAVQERLDVDHLMQQIRNGVCDLIDLASWLAKILKNHCAPMRDALVDAMQKEIKRGATENRPKKLVSGLRQLMSILEAMKLDVANHQIRHMRPLLIDDTINFQRRYNAHRIAIGKISLLGAKNWLVDHIQPHGCEPTPLLALTRGLIYDVVYNDSSSFCPPTFYLDSDRLRALRVEMHCRTYHAICRDVLRELAYQRLSRAAIERACDVLQPAIAAIVGFQGKFTDRLANIAAEIVRVLLDAEGVYPPFDSDLVCRAEQKLVDNLRQHGHAFRTNAMAITDQLVPKVQARVRDVVRRSALDLQDMLVPPVAPLPRSAMGFGAICEPIPANARPGPVDPDDDIVRRFTHIIALHWQVWADLVYLAEAPEKEDDTLSDNGSDSTAIVSSQTNSPTVPVAQAVYAPGRKWLPVSVTVTDKPTGLPTPSPSPQPEEDAANGEQSEESIDAKQQQQPA